MALSLFWLQTPKAFQRKSGRRSSRSALRAARPRPCPPPCSRLSDDTTMLHLVVDGRQNTSMRKQHLHIFFGVEDVTRSLSLRLIRFNVFSLYIQIVPVDEHEPVGILRAFK